MCMLECFLVTIAFLCSVSDTRRRDAKGNEAKQEAGFQWWGWADHDRYLHWPFDSIVRYSVVYNAVSWFVIDRQAVQSRPL